MVKRTEELQAFRDNGRIAFQDASLADNLWRSGIGTLFDGLAVDGRTALGLNPNFRLYRYLNQHSSPSILRFCWISLHETTRRYVKGQKFGPHIDESVPLGPDRETLFTVLIYLSGDGGKKMSGSLQGGSTVFYGNELLKL